MLEVWFAFVAGIAGSFHCIGMCGGIVAAISMNGGSTRFPGRVQSQLLYNAGRVVTYTLLGGLAGLAGTSLDLVAIKSASRFFLVAANLLVVMVGLSSALGLDALSLSSFESALARFLSSPLRRILSNRSPLASLPLGLLLGLLPCGLVYAPLIAAAGSGNPVLGAATMAALGTGTVPVMLVFGTASSAVSVRLRSVMLRLAGISLALLGSAGLWRALAR